MNPDELRADAEGVEQGIAEIAELIGLGPDDEPDSPARRCAAAARRLADVIEYADSIGLDSVAHIARGTS